MKSQGLKLVVQIYLSCLLQATQTELFKLTEEDHHVRDSPPVITTMLDISRDIGVHWKLNSDMFPYFDKTRDIREFLEDRADISCTFKDWDQVDDNSEGIWALMNQEARPWCDDVPYFQFNSMAGLVYFRSLTIRYFVHGDVYFNISSGDFLHEASIECEDGKCGKDFKEYTVNLAEDDDNRKSAFRLDFMIPEPDSVILIDKIWGEDKASTPTTIRPTTPKRFANSTTRDPAELTTTPSWAFRISSPSHFTFSGAILLTLGFFLY